MPFPIYDYRKDIRNLDITPEIRSRFMQLGPHEVAGRHSHDLGYEIFLVLEGQAEFEINGERAVVGPGQLCFARVNELHQVRNIGDTTMTLYLSVTPHVEPTHTTWTEQGEKQPPRYGGATAREYGRGGPYATPVAPDELLGRQAEALRQLHRSVAQAAERQEELLEELRRWTAQENRTAEQQKQLKRAIDALWALLYPIYRDVPRLEAAWNDLAVRLAGPASSVTLPNTPA